jgi:hypothetical protein
MLYALRTVAAKVNPILSARKRPGHILCRGSKLVVWRLDEIEFQGCTTHRLPNPNTIPDTSGSASAFGLYSLNQRSGLKT